MGHESSAELAEEVAALMECPHCGVTSTLPELFVAVRTRRRSVELLCPRCAEAWREVAGWKSFQFAFFLACLGWLLWMKGNGHVALVLAGLALAPVFMVLLVVLHELAHAIAAMALGMRVYWIVIGSYGRCLYQVRLGGCLIQINRLPLGGHTTTFGPETRFPRLRLFLVVLAGPLLHAVMIPVAWWILQYIDRSGVQTVWVPLAVMVFIYVNTILLVRSLWPSHSYASIGKLSNDGLLLLKIPFDSEETIRANLFYFYFYEPMARAHRRDFNGAMECLEEGMQRFPGNGALRAQFGCVFLTRGEFDAAASVFEEVRNLPAVTPQLDAMLRSDIAWCDVCSGCPDRLDRALDYSRVAMEAMPWDPAFRGTRGSALLLAGEIDEGIELLLEAWRDNEPAGHRSSNAAMLAIGAVRQGRHEDARQWLRNAEKLDPECLLLERARREVAEAAG